MVCFSFRAAHIPNHNDSCLSRFSGAAGTSQNKQLRENFRPKRNMLFRITMVLLFVAMTNITCCNSFSKLTPVPQTHLATHGLCNIRKMTSKSLAENPLVNVAVSRSICLAADNSRPRIIPIRGKSTIGSKAVANNGIASVIHQIAIQIVEASIAFALGFSPSGLKKNNTAKKAKGPDIKPIFFELIFIF